MANWNNRIGKSTVAACLIGAAQGGCGKAPEAPAAYDGPNAQIRSVRVEEPDNGTKSEAPTKAVVISFDQSFEEAVSTEVLDGQFVPPELTIGGKKTGPLRAALEELWPKIKLTDAAHRPVACTLKLETSEGPIEIALRPEIAPNHVRNILALAKLGFYDGLQFERNVHQEEEVDGQKSRLDLLIAGCPVGTGDEGFGHLGYFVRAELNTDLKHMEGTVGFWHEEDPDSAGTRFYITLGPAPALDGKFTIVGQVSKGLDVLKRIAAQPVKSTDPASPDSERPIQPASIKKIAISSESPVK